MKSIAVIGEMNPMHNGHIYLINEIKRKYADCALILIMTGNVSSRGDLSPLSKYNKCKLAIENGFDLVVELPYIMGCQAANIFAQNAVLIASLLKVDYLAFGSESGSIEMLNKAVLEMKSDVYNSSIKELLSKGYSYKYASSLSLSNLGITAGSNDILGISYLEAIQKLNSSIFPIIIKRKDESPTDEKIISATKLRISTDIKEYVPSNVFKCYEQYGFSSFADYYDLFKYQISSTNDFSSIFGNDEGILNGLNNKEFESYDSLVSVLTTKRYTSARIKRLLTYLLFKIPKDKTYHISYIRVLGINEVGKCFLNGIKKNLSVPLITNIHKPLLDTLELELKVARILSKNNELYEEELSFPYIK